MAFWGVGPSIEWFPLEGIWANEQTRNDGHVRQDLSKKNGTNLGQFHRGLRQSCEQDRGDSAVARAGEPEGWGSEWFPELRQRGILRQGEGGLCLQWVLGKRRGQGVPWPFLPPLLSFLLHLPWAKLGAGTWETTWCSRVTSLPGKHEGGDTKSQCWHSEKLGIRVAPAPLLGLRACTEERFCEEQVSVNISWIWLLWMYWDVPRYTQSSVAQIFRSHSVSDSNECWAREELLHWWSALLCHNQCVLGGRLWSCHPIKWVKKSYLFLLLSSLGGWKQHSLLEPVFWSMKWVW